METRVSGFIVTGSWCDIVEHGERVTAALHDIDTDVSSEYCESINDWEEWRPKTHEQLRDEVTEKTAEQASASESSSEKAGRTPDEELREASAHFKKSVDTLGSNPSETPKRWKQSAKHTAMATESVWKRLFRRFEEFIYRRVMTAISPYYFDTELISANISRNGLGSTEYQLEINITEDSVKSQVEERLQIYEENINRWHVSSQLDSESAEISEGIDDVEEQSGTTVELDTNLSQTEDRD